MKIEVLGSVCRNGKALEAATVEALRRLDIDRAVDEVTDTAEIVTYGVMSTPALTVAGKIQVAGRMRAVTELVAPLSQAG